jgi:choice-of-anchor B domain-containing protein
LAKATLNEKNPTRAARFAAQNSLFMSKLFPVVLWLSIVCLSQNLSAQLNLQQIGHLNYAPLSLAGCKAYVDSAGGEWALVGTSAGLSIVDLSDPTQPVERFAVPGLPNNWREMRTWNGFAYVGSEAQGSGITIVDLRELPDTIYWKVWLGDMNYDSLVQRSHTVQAVDGYLYIFGGGNVTNGCTIASLDDPWNPQIVGTYTTNYVHDGFIRGDTMWTSEIYVGQFGVVDISDKTDPKLIVTNQTPALFNHNTELSPDGKTLFAADEKPYAPLAAFDVSDLNNITLLDIYLASQRPEGEVHNVRVKGNFLVNPSYSGQLTIVDATRPDNLIETAWAITGTSLVWDADPYLPSGIIFATAKNEGLFVFQPTYQNAAWLEGAVTDSVTGLPLMNAKVFVQNTPFADTSKMNGQYKTGAAVPGSYPVQVVRTGYQTKIVPNVTLQTGVVTTLDIALAPEVVNTQNPDFEETVRVSPTLFKDRITVDILPQSAFAAPGTLIRLADISGKIVLEKNADSERTALEGLGNLPPGTYLLSLQNVGGRVATFRAVK